MCELSNTASFVELLPEGGFFARTRIMILVIPLYTLRTSCSMMVNLPQLDLTEYSLMEAVACLNPDIAVQYTVRFTSLRYSPNLFLDIYLSLASLMCTNGPVANVL